LNHEDRVATDDETGRKNMKATVIQQFGGPDVLQSTTVEQPTAGVGEVVVKVAACGVNRYDLYMRMGAVFTDIEFPHVIGADVAGTIVELGSDVQGLKAGDEVIVVPGFPIDPADWSVVPENLAPSFEVLGTHTWGGYAEFVRVPSRFVLPNQTGLPSRDVAALPLVLMTAVHAVETLGHVRSGMSVLVQAGASGSGNACVQLAAALGARVASTVGSNEKIDFVMHCGADRVINHKERNFANDLLDWTHGVGVDVVIDNVGASVFEDNLRALRAGGTFVNFGLVGGIKGTLNFRDLFFRQHQLKGSFMGSVDELRRGLGYVAQGKIRPMIDRVFPLSAAAEAHRYIESRAVKGKVLLVPD
jgi:NADPH2:quinone reductase